MGINRVNKRGKPRIEVRKAWPDGSTFRRYFPNMTAAKNVLTQIEASIATGTWEQMRQSLSYEPNSGPTSVEDLADLFLTEYAEPRLRSWKRYRITLHSLCKDLGSVPLNRFKRAHLHSWVKRRRGKVSAGTVNRDIAGIKKMFSFAWECGYLDEHPLTRFSLLSIRQRSRRVLSVEEFRGLVGSVDDPVLAALIAVLGETGLRKQEALHLKWTQIDRRKCVLTVEHTKNGKLRSVPLTDYALAHLRLLMRRLDSPHVFLNPRTERRWVNPEKAFKDVVRRAGFAWVGFHDLRRFRATQWVRSGIDVRTVKELLGHADIQTTMRYALYVESALEDVRRVQNAESEVFSTGDKWETGDREIASQTANRF